MAKQESLFEGRSRGSDGELVLVQRFKYGTNWDTVLTVNIEDVDAVIEALRQGRGRAKAAMEAKIAELQTKLANT
jgi:hypothetical protein